MYGLDTNIADWARKCFWRFCQQVIFENKVIITLLLITHIDDGFRAVINNIKLTTFDKDLMSISSEWAEPKYK